MGGVAPRRWRRLRATSAATSAVTSAVTSAPMLSSLAGSCRSGCPSMISPVLQPAFNSQSTPSSSLARSLRWAGGARTTSVTAARRTPRLRAISLGDSPRPRNSRMRAIVSSWVISCLISVGPDGSPVAAERFECARPWIRPGPAQIWPPAPAGLRSLRAARHPSCLMSKRSRRRQTRPLASPSAARSVPTEPHTAS
jgi:hypothetical protein